MGKRPFWGPRARRGAAKTGQVVVLVVLVAAIAGFWMFQMRKPKDEVSAAAGQGTKIGWCLACKKDFSVQGPDVAAVAKQGDKIQCPKCKKFEAVWGMPTDATPPSGVILP